MDILFFNQLPQKAQSGRYMRSFKLISTSDMPTTVTLASHVTEAKDNWKSLEDENPQNHQAVEDMIAYLLERWE